MVNMVVECSSLFVFHSPNENVLDYFQLHSLVVCEFLCFTSSFATSDVLDFLYFNISLTFYLLNVFIF